MTDQPPVPEVLVQSASKSLLQRFSLIWIVPALALLIVLGVAWHTYADRGPLIEIAFDNASGVRAGETDLRFRDVTVGKVEHVGFGPDLKKVIVSIRVNKDVAPLMDEDARFWIVKPEVTTRGVTGLNTVLSGVFIEGLWDDKAETEKSYFVGLSQAPLDRFGTGGLHLTLRATGEASLSEDTPILYRGIEVGRVGPTRISEDGSTSEAEVLIYTEHLGLITTATRFWDTSGFSFTIGPSGAGVNFSSLASLLSGGIAFETLVSGGEPVKNGAIFTVFTDESEARASAFTGDSGKTLSLTAIFLDNVSGLSTDSIVTMQGLQIGKVTALTGLVDKARFGDSNVRLVATIAVQPGRLGLDGEQGPDEALVYLQGEVQKGMRARLTTASILTGGLNIELVQIPDAPQASIDVNADPNPVIPTAPGKISDVSATAAGVFERINALPIEDLLNKAIDLMANINTLVASDDIRKVPGNLNGLMTDARQVLSSDDVKAVAGNLNKALDDLAGILDQIRTGDTVANANKAVASASAAADKVAEATGDLPDLIARAQGVLDEASRTLRSYRADGGMAGDARSALRQVEQAAQAVSALARELARKPNSLLIGR